MGLLNRAKEFAINAHGSQMRNYVVEPYWRHLERVARILNSHAADTTTIAAGWLHDTIEDTDTTHQVLVREFGEEIADIVLEVSNVSRPIHGKRPMRKRLDLQYLAGASWRAQMVKCADTIDNVPSIVEHDINFAQVYVPEKRALIDRLILAHSACFPIWMSAYQVVTDGERVIAEHLANVSAA